MGNVYQIIDRPMDFSTIKNQMEAMDGTGYKHVREICSDVRLVFKNAMKYNDEKSDVHVMAKTLLEKFEEKWLQFLPKVMEEVITIYKSYSFAACTIVNDYSMGIYAEDVISTCTCTLFYFVIFFLSTSNSGKSLSFSRWTIWSGSYVERPLWSLALPFGLCQKFPPSLVHPQSNSHVKYFE